MKTPRFTDADRFKTAYTNANATNISRTFARIRREQAEAAKAQAAAQSNVKPIGRKGAK